MALLFTLAVTLSRRDGLPWGRLDRLRDHGVHIKKVSQIDEPT